MHDSLLRQLEAPRPASARHNNRRSYYLHYSQFQLRSQQKAENSLNSGGSVVTADIM